MRLAAVLVVALLGAACSGEPEPAVPARDILVVANAALGVDAGRQIERGTQVAVERINARGGVRVAGRRHRLALTTMDTKGSAATAADNMRDAIGRGAVAIVGDGDGVDAVRGEAARLGVPIGIVRDGGPVIDPAERPNVFRVAPANHDLALRFREYLVPKRQTVAVLHDDGPYGRDALDAIASAFTEFRDLIAGSIAIGASPGAAGEVRQARRAGAEALLVWAAPSATAAVIAAARSDGWTGPIYTGPAGADPAVRESLVERPDRIDGVIFATARMAGGADPGAYDTFRDAYEERFGAGEIAAKQGGRTVVDPPRWAMYASDFVEMIAGAVAAAGSANPGSRLIAAMESVVVKGANGAERRFSATDHDAVDREEIFFARFSDFVWIPVKDDPRSAGFPDVTQIR
ncbi:MAG TPA: ABC transporter substrate-binding protein [Actinomycetota bacterium]